MLQLHVEATRTCLQRLLTCLRIVGLNLRSSLSLNWSTLRTDLREYIASLNADALLELAKWARLSPYSVKIARTGDGPDIFLLRRDIMPYEGCLPVIASRHIINEIGALHGFTGLCALSGMEVVRRSPDGFLDTRTWLFEYLCHTMLSSGSSVYLPRLSLSQCFPAGACKRKGALKVAHLCAPRSMETFVSRSTPPFDPDVYHITEILVDGTLHAILHARPDNVMSTPVSSAALSAATADQRRKLRPRVRAADTMNDRPSKRRRAADQRIVMFLQVIYRTSPQFTNDGLRKLEDIMHTDTDAEYHYVFVTAKDTALDLSAVPPQWPSRLKWYHLSVDIDIDGDHFT